MPFNFDMSEIVVLVVFAVILFGPEKLPELARKTGRVLNYVRNIANDAKGQIGKELGPEFENMSLADLNPKALVSKHILNPVQAELDPLKAELDPIRNTLTGVKQSPAASAGTPAAVDSAVALAPIATAAPSSPAPELIATSAAPAMLALAVAFDTEAT